MGVISEDREQRCGTTTSRTPDIHSSAANDLTALWRDPQKLRLVRTLVVVPLLLLFVTVCFRATYLKHETYVNSFEVWGVFHYYLGGKYAPELGYFDLYTCALDADRETGGVWREIVGVRDLRTYDLVPRAALSPCPRAKFTRERWKQFSADVEFFARSASPGYFSFIFLDKGFNAPPSWVAMARPIAEAIPLRQGIVATLLFNLDVVAVLAGILTIWRKSGAGAALLTAGLAIFYFGNFGRIGGNFCQYFWFPLVVAAVVLWRDRKPAWSGAALGLATALQAFPVFFAVPIVVRGIIDLARRRGRASWLPHLRFSAILAAVLLLAFLAGSVAGARGAWNQWRQKISVHKNYLRGEIFNIGLGTLTATAVSPPLSARDYEEDLPNTLLRLQTLERKMWVYYTAAAVFLLVWLVALLRSPSAGLFSLGFVPMFALVNLSPYYYLALALLPYMLWESGVRLRRYAVFSTSCVFAAHLLLFPAGTYTTMLYLPHLLSAASLAVLFLSLTFAMFLQSRPAHLHTTA